MFLKCNSKQKYFMYVSMSRSKIDLFYLQTEDNYKEIDNLTIKFCYLHVCNAACFISVTSCIFIIFRIFATRTAHHCAVDETYLDLLPDLYSNVWREVRQASSRERKPTAAT